MIHIERIEIDHIRGIKHFNRSLGGQSLAIQGPNGSGKSGVIDAIEFGLTGNFSRLKGRGTKSLTSKQHGKHVGSKEGTVKLTIFAADQDRSIVITRSTQNPTKPKIEPDDERARVLLDEIAGHPEVALTRRQIIRFILAESKDRSSELQALLRLEKVEHICEELRKAHTKCERERVANKQLLEGKAKQLREYLEVDDLVDDQILLALNQHRRILGLDSVLDMGMFVESALVPSASAKREINKREVLLELQAVRELLTDVELESSCNAIIKQLARLAADQSLAIAFNRHQLIGFGLAAIDSDECPLCDTEWDMAKLKEHLTEKLTQCDEAKEIHDSIASAAEKLAQRFGTLRDMLQQIGIAARRLAREDLVAALTGSFENVSRWRDDLKTQQGVASAHAWLTNKLRFSSLATAIASLATAVAELPDQSQRDYSQTFLFDAVRQLKEYGEARRKSDMSAAISLLANKTYQAYQQTSESVLNQLYEQVKHEFEESYRFLNEEDESDFESEFNTSENSLEIKAKFYQHGNHPPAAYHSEGHQDAMGLCLYLALMNQVFAGDLRLVILDDVVMSIDSGHRKKLCELLRTKFPHTQFIITTHERTWFKQMQTAKLIEPQSALQFSGWTVDGGPQIIGVVESWDAIQAALEAEDIPLAAWRLRNFLEHIACELADDLGAKVTFRANGEHAAGEIFPSVCSRFRELLKKAARAAKSWGHEAVEQDTLDLEKKFGLLFAEIDSHEYWMINPAVHYNQWQDFTKKDFASVVEAYSELLACFTCTGCKTMLRRNSSVNCSEMSCMCGGLNFRFVEATAAQKAARAAATLPVLKIRASS